MSSTCPFHTWTPTPKEKQFIFIDYSIFHVTYASNSYKGQKYDMGPVDYFDTYPECF